MLQGRQAIFNLLEGRAAWPPVVVPFGLDPCRIEIAAKIQIQVDGTLLRRHELVGRDRVLSMDEVKTQADSSWKVRKRWIENDADFLSFLKMEEPTPEEPDIEAVRIKERQVDEHGLPYAEVNDPFSC